MPHRIARVVPHRIARVVLAVALASSGVSAPFMHVHAHGSAHPVSSHGDGIDEHCAHHHSAGAHWHPAGNAAPHSGTALAAAGAGHRHAAVVVSAAAIESSPLDIGQSFAPLDAPESGMLSDPSGARAPVAEDAGPDPPPRTVDAARAPPARS